MSDSRRRSGSTPPLGYPAYGSESEKLSAQLRELKARLELSEREREAAVAKTLEADTRNQALVVENAALKQRLRNDPVVALQLAGFQKASTAMMIGYVNGRILIGNAAAERLLGDVGQVSIFPLLLDHMESPIVIPSETTGVGPFPRPYGHALWERFWKDESVSGDARVIHERVRIRSPLQPDSPFDVSLILKELRDDSDHPWIQIEIIPHDPLNRDEMTGLYRREVAINKIVRTIGSGDDVTHVPRRLAVVAFDIDDFKRYNTRYGYNGGNVVLYKVARLLERTVRASDLLVRWFNGDEFVIVLDGDAHDGQTVAEKVQAAFRGVHVQLAEPETGRKVQEPVTASIGWAIHEPGDNWKTLTDRAFDNAASSKKAGKDRVTGSMPPLSRPSYLRGRIR